MLPNASGVTNSVASTSPKRSTTVSQKIDGEQPVLRGAVREGKAAALCRRQTAPGARSTAGPGPRALDHAARPTHTRRRGRATRHMTKLSLRLSFPRHLRLGSRSASDADSGDRGRAAHPRASSCGGSRRKGSRSTRRATAGTGFDARVARRLRPGRARPAAAGDGRPERAARAATRRSRSCRW